MHQLEFDLSRADQTAILQTARLAGDGVVSSRMLKGVLLQIDDYARQSGECFASQETIALGMGCSEKSVKRAVRVLLVRSLITCELRRNRYGRVTNHYRIVWNELALLSDSIAGRAAGNDRSTYAESSRSHGTAGHQSPAAVGKDSAKAMGQSVRPMGQLGRAMGQSDQPMGQSDPQSVETNQPPSITSRTEAVTEVDCLDEWSAAREALRLCGLKARKQAIDLAKSQSMSPSYVVAICNQYRRLYKSKLKVGAIFFRIEQGDWPIDEPPPADGSREPTAPQPKPWIGDGSIAAPLSDEEKKILEQFGIK